MQFTLYRKRVLHILKFFDFDLLSSFFFLYMINIAYCNLKDFDYATDLLSDLSLGIETSVVDRLICYLYFNSPVIQAQLQVLAGSAHGLIQ